MDCVSSAAASASGDPDPAEQPLVPNQFIIDVNTEKHVKATMLSATDMDVRFQMAKKAWDGLETDSGRFRTVATIIEKVSDDDESKNNYNDNNIDKCTIKSWQLSQHKDYLSYYRREVEILSYLSHTADNKQCLNIGKKHIPHLIGHCLESSKHEKWGYVVIEQRMEENDDLIDRLNDGKMATFKIIQHLLRQMLFAIKYLHDRDIVHHSIRTQSFAFRFDDVETKNDSNSKLSSNSNGDDTGKDTDTTSIELSMLKSVLILADYDQAVYVKNDGIIRDELEKKKFLRSIHIKYPTTDFCAPETAFWQLYVRKYWYKIHESLKSISDEDIMNQMLADIVNPNNKTHKDGIKKHTIEMASKIETKVKVDIGINDVDIDIDDMNDIGDLAVLNENEYVADNPDILLFKRYWHMSPKVSKAYDIWSLGVVAYSLVAGGYPFRSSVHILGRAQTDSLLERIITRPRRKIKFGKRRPLKGSDKLPLFEEFLDKCLNKDPIQRATVDQLLENDQFIALFMLPWKIERIIWIAFEKNENNSDCFFTVLPKDLLKHILAFVGQSIG